MAQFTYSFCMAMLHSLWQAAVLFLLFIIVNHSLFRNHSPLAKRNFLFAALVAQTVLFIFTFFIFFFETQTDSSVAALNQKVTDFLGSENIRTATPWIFSIYLFVILFKLTKALYSWYRFQLQYKTGLLKPAIDLKLFAESKACQFGIKRSVKLWLSNSIHTPVTFGYVKPVILLPVALINNLSTKQAETLILHELTHICTHDYLLNWFLLFAETIFFFNPFVKSICNKIRMEREKNCDIRVMAFEYAPALYAETLLQAERMKQMIPNFQLAAVNRKKQLLQRILFFSGNKTEISSMRFNIVAPLIGLLLLLLFSSVILLNTGNPVSAIHSPNSLPYLPFNDAALSADADFSKTIIPGEKGMAALIREMEKQKPVIEKKLKSLEPLIKEIQKKTESFISKQVEENPVVTGFAIPVASKENDAARQIIIKEESSGSTNASVKVFYLAFENGQWVLRPEWMLTTKEVSADSLLKKMDTSAGTLKRILSQQ